MNNNYTIILFKNKVRYKILKKYKTFKKAENFFKNKMDESNNVKFNIEYEGGKKVDYELALIEKNSNKLIPLFKTDELGRNIKIKSDNDIMTIIKLEKYNLTEKIQDLNKKKKIDFNNFLSEYLNTDNLKMVSKINNKIFLQDEDEINLFSLKNEEDAERFLICLEEKIFQSNKINCILIRDTDKAQKKYIYKLLEEKGFNKDFLYRKSTTHSKDK
jgi:hypothetical protein